MALKFLDSKDSRLKMRKNKSVSEISAKQIECNENYNLIAPATNSDFELPTVNHFISAAMSGIMPGGEKTALPLFPKEAVSRLSTKYADWAPDPWSQLPPRPTVLGPMPGDSPPPLFRVMQIASGLDGLLTPPQKRIKVERSFKLMKTKVISL